MRVSEVLRTAAEIIIERGLCRGHFAVDVNGEQIESGSPNAAQFCTVGAIWKAEGFESPATGAVSLTEWLAGGELTHVSDAGTAADAIRLLDAAMVVALQEEGIEPEDVLSPSVSKRRPRKVEVGK